MEGERSDGWKVGSLDERDGYRVLNKNCGGGAGEVILCAWEIE